MEVKDKYKADFGSHLRVLLLNENLSLRGLAVRSGLEYSQVQRIASGQVNVTLKSIRALAEGLKIHPSKLLDY